DSQPTFLDPAEIHTEPGSCPRMQAMADGHYIRSPGYRFRKPVDRFDKPSRDERLRTVEATAVGSEKGNIRIFFQSPLIVEVLHAAARMLFLRACTLNER